MIKIDDNAPVIARSEIEIQADPDTIWDVLVDINNWPRWNPDIKSASLEGRWLKVQNSAGKPGPYPSLLYSKRWINPDYWVGPVKPWVSRRYISGNSNQRRIPP